MATITKIATAAGQAAGSPFNGSFSTEQNVRNATDINAAGDNLYATAAPGKNQEYASVWPFAFTSTDVPDNATISAVSVKVQWKSSSTTSASSTSSAFADSAQATSLSAVPGVSRTWGTANTDTDDTYSLTTLPSITQLRNGIWIRAQALRGNTNTAMTLSLDYIQVTVTYTAPTTVGGSFTANAIIKSTIAGTFTADAVIKAAVSGNFTADAIIQKTASASFTADAQIASSNPTWASPPADLDVINTTTPTLYFNMPAAWSGNILFEIQLDTVNTFDSANLRTYRSYPSQTGWEYYNGTTWAAMPSGGLANTYAGNQGRFTVPTALTQTTWYRRIRAGA